VYPTDLTVAAVVENDGRYLLVEEHATGLIVLNQPGGHIEAGETPEEAVIRETLEETGCAITCCDMIGVYLWIHPQTRQQFLRIVYTGSFDHCDESLKLDDGIVSRQWLTRADLEGRRKNLRTPAVMRCVQDFEAGRRESDKLFSGMLPLQNNVHRVLARADLV
jgi:8-oxo-dGTP pyrophosphatase MutT (NUDIX family)